MNTAEANVHAAGAMADELARSGVRHVCMSPGSRSAPLALAFDRHPALELRMITDERAAAYFALGVARAGREPVVIACTSGTAVANFMPAVIEAALARVALIVLTADRPPELHDVGAPQTIRQSRMFANHAVWSIDAAVPDASLAVDEYFRTLACRLVATATERRGPVHANIAFREPLWNDDVDATLARAYVDANRPARVRVAHALAHPADEDLDRLARCLAAEPCGIVVAGPAFGADLAAAVPLANALGWPLLADPLSGLRFGSSSESVVDAYDLVLRNDAFCTRNRPRAVLRVGAPPTSKVLQNTLSAWRTETHVVLADSGEWPDPGHCMTELVRGDVAAGLAALRSRVDGLRTGEPDVRWRLLWSQACDLARAALDDDVNAPLHEGAVARCAVEALDDGDSLVIGNSMPIRDVDTFAPRCARRLCVYANRGANGIDGVMSTALGIASVSGGRTLLLVGDLSFLHDLGALQIAARHAIDLTVLLVNNDGGGVFSFLPRPPSGFEELFATPHGLDLARIVEAHGAWYRRADTDGALRVALQPTQGGLGVVEVRVEREQNARARQRLVAAAAACVTGSDEAAA